MTNPIPGADAERYCLACDKAGHRTDDCWSTHGINTPQARELFRLVRAAAKVGANVAAELPDNPLGKAARELLDIWQAVAIGASTKAKGDADKSEWSYKQWWEHVGAWETQEGYIAFGSPMAVRAMLIQFGRALSRTNSNLTETE